MMITTTLKKNQISVILGFILLISSSCEQNYSYLSERDKEYLLYDLGDTVMFLSQSDTIYGQVSEKYFFTTSNGIFGSEYYEVGFVHIRNLLDTVYGIANIEVCMGDNVTYEIGIFIEQFESSLDSCMKTITPFKALLNNGELFHYSNDEQRMVKMEPVIADLYQLNYVQEYCPDRRKSTLYLNKSKGLSMLILDDSDSIKISVR